MDRYVSPPLQVPAPSALYKHDRVDLEMHGVEHSGESFAVRVFVNAEDAGPETPAVRENPAYAGSFYIFGHGPCLGDEGPRRRPPGPKTPLRLPPAASADASIPSPGDHRRAARGRARGHVHRHARGCRQPWRQLRERRRADVPEAEC